MGGTGIGRSRGWLRSDNALLAGLAFVKLGLHLAFNAGYGYFRDELYNIVCGERLGFGFVDHPPLTPLLARLSRAVFGDSLGGLRFLPAVAGAATVFLAGLIARRLGGKRFAQGLASLAVLLATVILVFDGMLTNNSFDILFWTLAAWLLLVILQDGRPRLWPAFGAVAGVGLQNKYSVAFFVAGLVLGLLLTSRRREFLRVWPWAGAAVALGLWLPNIVWQVRNGLPFIELNRNAVLFKNTRLSPLDFLAGQAMEIHPLNFLLLLAGLAWCFMAPGKREARIFGWAYLFVLGFFVFSGGKAYYMSPFYPTMLAAGAVAAEKLFSKARRGWLKPAAVVLLVVTAVPTIPFALPVLPVGTFVSYARALGFMPPASERKEMGALPQHFADRFGWPELAADVGAVFRSLPKDEQQACLVFGQNYGEAAAIDVFGRELGLPRAASGHNHYYLWGPGVHSPKAVIIVGGRAEDHRRAFADVREAARHRNAFAMPYESDLPIYVCRGPKVPLRDLWPSVKHYD